MCTQSNELIKSEFENLRNEIDSAKERLFRLFVSGITLPLVVIAIITKYPEVAGPVVFALPILLLSACFRYEYEREVINRAGNYIRCKLEPKSNNSLGWETWLKSNNNKVLTNKSLSLSFYSLITLYYFAPSIVYILQLEGSFLTYLNTYYFLTPIGIFYFYVWGRVIAKPIINAIKPA